MPAKRTLLVALALVPLAVLCAPVPGLGFAFVAAAGALLGAFLFDGLRYRAETFLEVERELPRSLSVGEAATIRLRVRNHASVPLEITVADGCGSGLGQKISDNNAG